MGMKSLLKHAGALDVAMSTPDMAWLISHSVLLGVVMMTITVFTTMQNGPKTAFGGKKDLGTTMVDLLYNSSNVLYICVGMTSVMLLVSNSLARAFAIGAVISLVRFRIKIDSKNFAMCLLYGMIVGMACGVNQVPLAYGMAGVFLIIQALVLVLAKIATRAAPAPESAKVIPIEAAE